MRINNVGGKNEGVPCWRSERKNSRDSYAFMWPNFEKGRKGEEEQEQE